MGGNIVTRRQSDGVDSPKEAPEQPCFAEPGADPETRWQALAALLESERRFRTVAGAARDMVTETDSKGLFTYVSPACTEVLGYSAEELLGQSPLRLHHDEDIESFVGQLRSHDEHGQVFGVAPHRLKRRDGSWIWVEAKGVRYRRGDGELCLIGVARDITDRIEAEQARRMLEGRVRRAQKLESLGVLARGIAHDFNNYLTPILGSAGLLEGELVEGSPLRPHAEAIRKAARRAMALTRQMLAYAGETDPRLDPLDLSEAALDMQLLLESSVSHRACLVLDLESGLPLVLADREQIGQVIMNLVTNAAEASIDESSKIEFRTGTVDADAEYLLSCQFGEGCVDGRYVFFEVRDEGPGIEEDVLGRIFDPFFSTKLSGRGLGLAVVLGIVQGHGGALRIVTERGEGTTFRVLLPVSSAATAQLSAESPKPAELAPSWIGRGVFLVVDDDDGAREISEILLRRAGFTVLAAADGREAVEIFRRHAAEITGVVLDKTMPGMSGSMVLDAIREIAPKVPVVLASGYSEQRIPEDLLARGNLSFLSKPFDAAQLEAAVRRLLEPDG